MDWIIGEFKKDTGIDLSKQPDAVQRIKEESEKAKEKMQAALKNFEAILKGIQIAL